MDNLFTKKEIEQFKLLGWTKHDFEYEYRIRSIEQRQLNVAKWVSVAGCLAMVAIGYAGSAL